MGTGKLVAANKLEKLLPTALKNRRSKKHHHRHRRRARQLPSLPKLMAKKLEYRKAMSLPNQPKA